MNQDDDLEALIEITAQLQLEDIQIWRASQKGKTREGGRLSDAEVSFNAMEAEHKATLQRAKDRRIARGLERAVTQDIDLIRVMAAIEAQERSDRQIALALSDTANTRPPAQTTASQIWAVPTQIRSPSTNSTTSLPTSSADSVNTFLSSLITNSSRTSVAESLNSTRTSVAPGFIPPILKLAGGRATADCVICGEAATAAYHAPCGCFYDRDCLTELFQKATVDESLFPPRCCNQQILFQNVRSVFSPQLIQAFEEKTEEFKTTNRLYCHNPICSAFIGPAVGSERTRENKACTRCARHTCSFCKGPGHPTYMTCPIDAGAQQVLALGRQEGWQSCPSCHHMVELELGCYHMTCRCRHQFCYLCSQEWKSCTCPQWDENRLIVAAQGRVVRQHGPLPPAPRPAQINERTTEVFRMANQLRANHQCAHHTFGFAKLNGAGSCESCGRQSREFLLRCRGCSIQVCVHCRRNRL